ncbi:PBSX phage terminase small subunit [Lysinibacillus capsici]|uniref:PBSX phage terminase small subunit n=1 Tax=Lysinibacillus capsici TaxID=2115968 RepID=A0A2X0Y7G7_9BACI|nr:terminase small subunit [Lysinibacillus capsici]SPT98400.1 PBSX phage terminase small subunit [Lysinibacillus capsici]
MANWDEIKQEWETTKITLADLAEKHGIKLGTLKSRKSREKWSRDATEKDATKTKKVATINEDAPKDEVVYFADDDESGLNDKQRLFIAYYVKCWNATKAYQKAYKCDYATANANGSRLLANASIREEIIKVRDGLTQDALLDKRTLIQKWIDIAFADITDYVKFGRQEEVIYNNDGQPELDMNGNVKTYAFNYVHLNESAEIDGSLITEVKQGKDGISVKLADKMKAMDFLSKHLDLLNERELKHYQAEKLKAETDFAEMRAAKLRGDKKDTSMLDALVEGRKQYEQMMKEREQHGED